MDKETSEIAKLTGRISKDPKSKLFVPLAEEYKKAGDVEMAIHVLLEGLKNNPDYATARSSLGKLLFAKGDFVGAQKEFEDVIRSIPDNVLAQKKLGDLFVLQDRPLDALSHYKIAFSLNPGDSELAALISDVEAGRDARFKIKEFRANTSDEQPVKLGQAAVAAVTEPVSGPVPHQPPNIEPESVVETSPVSGAVSLEPLTDAAQTPAFQITEMEEAEEVLVVEPLEPEVVTQEPPETDGALTGEQELPAMPSAITEEAFDFDLLADNQLPDEVVSQDVQPETEPATDEDGETIQTGIPPEIAADETIETGRGEDIFEDIPAPLIEDGLAASDDFTTDTLAELYISQGFFEKAVEIYERMLVDRPNSRGLQEKLAWVRASVAPTAAPVSEQRDEEDTLSAPEAMDYLPAVETGEVAALEPLEEPEEYRPQPREDTTGVKPEAVAEAGEQVPAVEPEEMLIEAEVVEGLVESGLEEKSPEENIAAGFNEDRPASGPEEQATAGEGAGFSVLADSPVKANDAGDFEPREYVPPDMKHVPPVETVHHEPETHVPGSNAGRKETIARLETWLTTIKKEK